jgi:hypothetical protein
MEMCPGNDREGAKSRGSGSETARRVIAPAVLYIVCMVGFPFILAICYSLSDATTGDPSLHFVGLENFKAILKDPVFRKSLGNTFIFTLISQSLVIILSQALALALAKDFRGKWLARFFILLPWTAPIALGTIGWLWMLDSIFSPFDWLLRAVGLLGSPSAPLGPLSNLYWLGEPVLAMTSVILVHIWRILPLATSSCGRPQLHSPGNPRSRGSGWRGLLAPPCADHHPAAAPHHEHRVSLWTGVHLHRHDRGLRADPRRSRALHPGLSSWAFFRASKGDWPGSGRSHFPSLLAVWRP